MAFRTSYFVSFMSTVILILTTSMYYQLKEISSRLSDVADRNLKPFYDLSLSDSSRTNPLNSNNTKHLRRAALRNVLNSRKMILEAANQADHNIFYKSVAMEAFCEKNVRIGNKGDGGKHVCNPAAVKKEACTLLSLGLSNNIEFDLAIHKATEKRCKILGADKDAQNSQTQKSYEEIGGQLFVGMIPNQLQISTMLSKSGRSDVELLKIDIEGGEVTGLEPFIKDYFVCQILIELHGEQPHNHLEMLRMMSRYGFRLFNIEPNPYCKHCCEYSLINEMCMTQFGVVPLAITIPH